MSREKYLKLGELLIKEGLITEAQLQKVIAVQKQDGGRLGEILIKLEMVQEEQMVLVLAKQLGISYFTHGTGMLKPAASQDLEKLIPYEFALKNLVLPLSRTLRSLSVAMADPLDLILIDNLRKITGGCEINPLIATRGDITKAIHEFYGKSKMFQDAVAASYLSGIDTEDAESSADEELSLDKLIARAEEAPVVKLVDLIIRQAIDEHASDIHIEPFKEKICLRYRIDGKLYEIPPPSRHLHLPIISRIKILAKLDISEKRLPQDGAFLVKIEGKSIDLRISCVPTIYGEKIVMRILDRSNIMLDLLQLGYEQGQLDIMRKAMFAPFGLMFMTGPTGSGKTTSLYAILHEIRDSTKNIVTVEDPVEYKLDGINQVQVRPEIGLTFAAALRSFLRQDPDVMLVGEVRDLETAEICIRSALTGHLVLSTLHTNDAPSAITRLCDIGVESYLLAPSLLCIVAQRLVRKLCPYCKEAYEPTADQIKTNKLKVELIYKQKGCEKCNQLGYKGRLCVSEVMLCIQEIRESIMQKHSTQKIREIARANGMQTLYEIAMKKVEEGTTSLEEALAVTIGGESVV